jgi:enoyl-[acyl-carrier protein] reductase II
LVGLEGAGFKNVTQLPTLINIPSAANLLNVPLIAAGGIGDSRSFLAALSLGAEAAYLATAFMATTECPISNRYKQVLVDSVPWDPKVRDRCLAPPRQEEYERVVKQRATLPQDEWLRALEKSFSRQPARDEDSLPSGWTTDLQDADDDLDPEQAFRNSGGSLAVGVLDRVKSAQELIDDIILGAEEILKGSGALGRIHGALIGQ